MFELDATVPLNISPTRRALRRPLGGGGSPLPRPAISEPAVSTSSINVSTVDGGDNAEQFAPSSHLWIVLAYFAVSYLSQLMLLIPQMGVLRKELRILPYGVSLILTLILPDLRARGQKRHPAALFAVIILCIMCVGLVNQYTDSIVAGCAQIVLTVSILCPILWVGRLRLGSKGVSVIILCLWCFNAASAGVGCLQVLYPGHFVFATSTVTQELEDEGITYHVELANGEQIERPYGLSDMPAGAASAGMIAFIFGLGLLVASKRSFMRAVYLVGMGVGLFVMYLSQVRVSIVMCGVATVTFVGIMTLRGEFARLTGALIGLTIVILLSTSAALLIGGDQTRDRLFTMVDDNAGNVYQSNRGHFLDYTFEYVLPTYPVGAGLGRYGMMSYYFNKSSSNQSLWVEIQWTAWAYDGGWLLVIAYPVALLVALWVTFDIGRKKEYGAIGLWAAILAAYNMSALACTFDGCFFLSQFGMEFWLLNTAIFSAAYSHISSQRRTVPEGFESIPAPWRPNDLLSVDKAAPAPAFNAPRQAPLRHPPLPGVVPIFKPPSFSSDRQ